MGAEIVWPPAAADGGARRIGVLRFGPFFAAATRRDPYDGCGTVEDHGDWCLIGPLSSGARLRRGRLAGWVWRGLTWLLGHPAEFDAQDWDEILTACAGWGFGRAEFERHGKRYAVDLAAPPFKMRRTL